MTANKTTISCKISGPVDMNKSFRSPYRRFLAPFLLSFLIPIVTPEHINDDANITNSSMVPTANILTPAPTSPATTRFQAVKKKTLLYKTKRESRKMNQHYLSNRGYTIDAVNVIKTEIMMKSRQDNINGGGG